MKDLMKLTDALQMTSLEIAELTGKQHKNVLRDLDSLLETLGSELSHGFKSSTYTDQNGVERRLFVLDRDSTVCLVTGYDVTSRMRVIKRWQELEAQASRAMSPAEVLIHQGHLMLALEQEQARQAQVQQQIEARQESTERRLDQIETATDHFTIVGWHRYAKMGGSLPVAEAAKMGKTATRFCKDHEIDTGSVPDPRFGTVKTYPKWVLDELFTEARPPWRAFSTESLGYSFSASRSSPANPPESS